MDHYGNVFQTQHYDATVAAVATLSASAPPGYRTLLTIFTGAQCKFCVEVKIIALNVKMNINEEYVLF